MGDPDPPGVAYVYEPDRQARAARRASFRLWRRPWSIGLIRRRKALADKGQAGSKRFCWVARCGEVLRNPGRDRRRRIALREALARIRPPFLRPSSAKSAGLSADSSRVECGMPLHKVDPRSDEAVGSEAKLAAVSGKSTIVRGESVDALVALGGSDPLSR